MDVDREPPGPGSTLGVVGLSAFEEQVYEALLERRRGSLTEISASIGCSERRTREVLGSLRDKGLVSRAATRSPVYVATSPDTAVETLIRRRRDELEQARLTIPRLRERFRTGVEPASWEELAELITGYDAMVARYYQLISEASGEILAFAKHARPPVERHTEWKLEILRRGVQGRVVYTTEALEVPGMVDFIQAVGPAGELARTTADLPMNLLIVDGQKAFFSLSLRRQQSINEWLFLEESSLLDALLILFEAVWQEATPFPLTTERGDGRVPDDVFPSEDDRRLLGLMAAGMRDVVIARQLGVAPRTIERRVSRIMADLKTRTRFQTAVEAARRGWLPLEQESAADKPPAAQP